jgi:hypothetical protein
MRKGVWGKGKGMGRKTKKRRKGVRGNGEKDDWQRMKK